VEAQALTSIASLVNDVARSLIVRGPWHGETPRAPPRRKGASPKARPRKRKRRKKGGWRALAGLTWAQVKDVRECAKLATEAGLPLNAFFTIKADWRCSTDQARKRGISRKIAHLGQALKGRGRTPRQIHFVAVTVYEKKQGGILHAHVLAHVENFAFARQISDGAIVNVIRARPNHLDYITKQRLPFSPEVEAGHWRYRQSSEKIVGARLSFSTDAKALIAARNPDRTKQSVAVAAPPSKQRMIGIGLGRSMLG
jgi:hypothetical protein